MWLYWNAVLSAGAVLVVITYVSQLKSAAPYGRHDPKDGKWGPGVNQVIGHILNDGLWGFIYFLYLLYQNSENGNFGIINVTFMSLWLVHFIHRGFVHPLYMRYSSKTISVGIPLTGLTLAYFSYIHASYLTLAVYPEGYVCHSSFIIGLTLFAIGFGLNKWSDVTLRNLRSNSGDAKYYVPTAAIFKFISCPNYLGEIMQWLGWALSTWSVEGLLYFLFVCATCVPRSKHNHQWCMKYVRNYPKDRNALIPGLY
ncbi:hypothetical protein CHUAL_006235 [Chamberlinius hualienensis]